jgi:3-dehydroquinate dehydratase type I
MRRLSLIKTYRICVPVKAEDVPSATKMIMEAEELMVDFIEVRIDCMRDIGDLTDIAGSTRIPLIATFRPKRQGGLFDGRDEERIKVLEKSINAGFEYVDLELDTSELDKIVEDFKNMGVKLIISHHNLNRTPTTLELKWLLSRELSYGPDICKLVTYANHLEDNLTCLEFLSKFGRNVKLVCFAMGELGLISRILSPLYGGFFTFASLKKGLETAPGQLTVGELRAIIKVMEAVGF